ncbi:MAG: transcription antitermination factor NusB [Bacillota bacterium]
MTRHDSRVLALRALFCWEVGNMDPDECLNYLVVEAQQELILDPDNVEYARALTLTAIDRVSQIDQAIDEVSVGWPVQRMPKVDLSIIRLAYAEAIVLKGAPVEVVLDEAVELAKEFGTHASPKFVNGLLMGIFRKMGWSRIVKNGTIRE